MQFTVKGSHLLALIIVAGIGAWMYGGEIEIGGQAGNAQTPAAPAVETEAAGESLFKVNVVTIDTVTRNQEIPVRGRTKAEAVIPIRTETPGVLEKRLFNRGDRVEAGDLVCVIQQGARRASLLSAEARFEQMKADYAANEQLLEKGFITKTVMRQKRFDLNAAKAQLEQARIELERTEVIANASGIVQDPVAEVGDVLTIGGACLTLIDSHPMFFTGQVSEQLVDKVERGMTARVRLVSNQVVNGKITYIAPSADPQTRTISVEIELEDNGIAIRDGLTATAAIQLPPEQAIRISPSWLTLADSGAVGVKVVDEADTVRFKPVSILSQSNDGFWIAGLEAGDRVITLGQEYVVAGEVVEPVQAAFEQAKVQQ